MHPGRLQTLDDIRPRRTIRVRTVHQNDVVHATGNLLRRRGWRR
jgi:hypothetical protein